MDLITVDQPTFDVKVPSSGKTLKFRPFLVKEQKILLMAFNSENPNQIYDSLKQIIQNCCITEKLDIDKLHIYDIEFIFLQLRIHSISETLTLYFQPIPNSECKKCSQVREVTINLNEAEMFFPEEDVTNTVFLNAEETKGIKLKYPDLTIIQSIQNADSLNDIDTLFEMFWHCVDSIFDGDKVQSTKEIPASKGVEWIESLPVTVFEKIQKYFKNTPYLKQEVTVKCSECDFEDKYTLRGLDSFFG
jgi:hypothetical protein